MNHRQPLRPMTYRITGMACQLTIARSAVTVNTNRHQGHDRFGPRCQGEAGVCVRSRVGF